MVDRGYLAGLVTDGQGRGCVRHVAAAGLGALFIASTSRQFSAGGGSGHLSCLSAFRRERRSHAPEQRRRGRAAARAYARGQIHRQRLGFSMFEPVATTINGLLLRDSGMMGQTPAVSRRNTGDRQEPAPRASKMPMARVSAFPQPAILGVGTSGTDSPLCLRTVPERTGHSLRQ